MKTVFQPAKAALAFALATATFGAAALPARIAQSPAEALQLLASNANQALSHNARVEKAYSTVQAARAQVLLADSPSLAPLARAQNFLSVYGVLPGVTDSVHQLALQRVSDDGAGNQHVHLDQVQSGLPVFGARMVVHMNRQGITGYNGVFVPGLESLSTTPARSIASLRATGLKASQKLHPKADNLRIESTRLMFYRGGLLKQGETHQSYLAYEVMVRGGTGAMPVRDRIILNANNGKLLNWINEIHTTLNREIFTPGQTTPDPAGTGASIPVPPTLTEGGATSPPDTPLTPDNTHGDGAVTSSRVPPVGPTYPLLPLNNLYVFAGGTYALYKNLFGREGYNDGAVAPEEQVQKSVYLVNDQCPNAYWDGDATNYCPAFDADDVVSHEWSHAYTEYTHGLIYQGQSGALNESYSDIFGETYDLVNGIEGTLGASLTEGDYYENRGSRWVVGEDLSEALAVVLLRDMWDPDNFPAANPGKTSSENYDCDEEVHFNSSVPNHGYAMLVDGKEYNGHTITGIGITKAAHIYYQAETHHQTPTTDFAEHADALEQSCQELIGAPLNDSTGALSPDRITIADCKSVHEMTEAVEFRRDLTEQCGFKPILQPEASTPALCGSGLFVTPTFTEGFNGAAFPASWTQGKNVTGDTDIQGWVLSSDLPAPHSGQSAFFKNDGGGTCAAGGDQSAEHWMDSPQITLENDASFFKFTHFVQTEAGFDGGNLKVSLNGGAFAIVPGAAFFYNGHSGAFGDAPLLPGVPDPVGIPGNGNNTSPLAGEAGWTGVDQGKTKSSWGTTVVDLSKLATAAKKGDKVVFRFDFGNDGCGGNLGWFVEDVSAYYCSATAPANTLPVASLTSNVASGTAPLNVVFTLGGSDVDAGDRVVGYSLNFGDGSSVSTGSFTAGKTVSHSYSAGNYTAQLTVTDSHGAVSAAVTKAISVTPGASSGGTSGGGGSSSGGTTEGGNGRFGGAFGGLLLLPLLGGAALRRRRRG